MATRVAATSNSPPEPTNENEDQLWKIIEKQRIVIQDLQKALAQVTADRDQLLTRHDRCDSLDDAMMSSTSSSSSSSVGPIPPPRSPFRQKDDIVPNRVDSLVVEKDVSTRSSSLPTRPVSPISSPVNAIMDKDAQQFARYQESQKSWKGSVRRKGDDAWHWPPPPPPPTKKTQRHVRRASSQPAISTAQKKNDDMENSLAGINVKVLGSNITPNSKGKGVISFTISVRKDMDDLTRELWRIEKLYSDFLQLDGKLKATSRPRTGKISKLPDKALFATHTPNKADQRKMAIEKYLQHMINVPWHNSTALCDFLSSNRIDRKDDNNQSTPGRKEGYLTKRGKNFGGWKTRYFVLDGPTLRYYESRDGALQGTIHIPDTQIARQHAQSNTQASAEMRHAFLIVEPKKMSSPTSGVNRHLLCAESDEERDQWVEALTQYLNWGGGLDAAKSTVIKQSSAQTLSAASSRKVSKDDIKPISAVPLSHINNGHNKFATRIPSPPYYHPQRSNSADSSAVPFSDSEAVPVFERPPLRQRSSMDHAYFPAIKKASVRRGSIDVDDSSEDGKKKKGNRRTFWAKKIFTGDMATSMPSTNSIRGFLSRNSSDSAADHQGQPTSPNAQQNTKKSRVFGVPLEEAIRSSRISDKCELPAVVYRCIEYLEVKNATQEEGIYRLSGSAVKIKALKQQFDQGEDINLLESNEYHDIHAVAGLLKMWLRELPGNVLTHELLKEFLPVIDLVDREERIKELGRLVSMLPLANYTLLRLLCAHLIRVVQFAETNKMNARNVGIIFSPTLQIPAGIFSLFLSEFEYIFWTTNDSYESNKTLVPTPTTDEAPDYFSGPLHPTQPVPRPQSDRIQMLRDDQGRCNRNSVHYMDGTPSSIVGLENGNAIIPDDDEDVEDLELTDDEEYEEEVYDRRVDQSSASDIPSFGSSARLLVMK